MGNIWTRDPYIYSSTTSGLAIYDFATTSLIDFVVVASGVNSVWANDNYIYYATISGVQRFAVSSISGTITTATYLVTEESNYLHGAGDYLVVSTAAGGKRIYLPTNYIDTSIYKAGTGKCFQTSVGDLYMTTLSGLYVLYEAGGSYDYLLPVTVNDIYVTEATSTYSGGGNVLFLATTSGAYVIEERPGDEINARQKIYLLDT